MRSALLFLLVCLFGAACQAPPPGVWRLDVAQGFREYVLGDSLYSSVIGEARRTTMEYDVLEFEVFGSRFADRLSMPFHRDRAVYGAPVVRADAGVIDRQIYAFLLHLDAGTVQQRAVLDSLTAAYGPPTHVNEQTVPGADMYVQVDFREWVGERVTLAYGMGDGYAELLVYDQALRARRLAIQRTIAQARETLSTGLAELEEVGTVQLQITEPFATWRYRYRREAEPARDGMSGSIDYSLVQPFFEVRGRSLYGLDMAHVTLHFLPRVDSLQAMEVRFDNTQGQTIGFVEMLNTLERKLGRAAYADTLHTRKGPFRRAVWYSPDVFVTLEEHRFRPGTAAQADIIVRFDVRRDEVKLDPDRLPRIAPHLAEPRVFDSLAHPLEMEL